MVRVGQRDSPSAPRRYVHRPPVRIQHHRPILARAEHVRACPFITGNHARRGMTEAIAASRTEDDRGWTRSRHERIGTRRGAPMVRSLHNRNRAERERRNHRPLTLRFDVPREHDRDVAHPNFEHDGIVVAHPLALPVGQQRMKHPNLDRPDPLAISRLHGSPRCAGRRRLGRKLAQFHVWRDRDTIP